MYASARLLMPFLLLAIASGCPVFESGTPAQAASSDLGTGGIGALEGEFPPPPSKATLCRLRFWRNTIDDVRELLGEPDSDQRGKSEAALSYHFRGDVTMHLTFFWSDGDASNLPPKAPAGFSKRAYILNNAAIMGQPYPDCWPHKEEEG